MCARLDEVRRTLKYKVLELLDTNKALSRVRVHEETWSCILALVGTEDIPALNRVFRAAKEENWSAEKLLEKLQKATRGEFRPRRFREWELDLATTIYELGGGAALHALHNSPYAFPARTTILAQRQNLLPRISTGDIRMTDLLHNIKIMFEGTKPSRNGVTLMMDEVACDSRLCYLAEVDDIAGLCEHVSSKLKSVKMGNNLDVIHGIAAAVRKGEIHVGQEVFVAAIARNDETDYGAKPILLRPTCKQGTHVDALKVNEMLVQAWNLSPYGKKLHGPILSVSSDGDPKRRPALFQQCLSCEVTPEHPSYEHLHDLPGFNLYTGTDGQTQDLDYKHTFKRVCTLLCTREGMVINGVVVHKDLLALWLERLSDIDWSENSLYDLLNPEEWDDEDVDEPNPEIEVLLRPKDAQDVPRAIRLLTLIAKIRHLAVPNNASEQPVYHALSLLGEMLDALVTPFLNPTLSLSNQIILLTKFAFIAAALYVKHGSSFMPHHLYSDLQCMFKTAVCRVAQMKDIDPELKVFLCHLGTDRLEVLFGRSRMIGAHSPNMDVSELRVRFGSALRLDRIFAIHPEWERRPERLKLARMRDLDHLSPFHWTGELRGKSCNLKECYGTGIELATAVFATHGCNFDIQSHFSNSHARKVDLLRPNGGKYPGVSKEVDRSLVASGCDSTDSSAAPQNSTNPESSANHTDTLEEPQPADIHDIGVDTELMDSVSFNGAAVLAAEAKEDTESSLNPSPSVWMPLGAGNKVVHKKTVLRVVMDPTSDVDYKKSQDRLLRVRYFSIGGQSLKQSKGAHRRPIPGKTFRLGSLYATVVGLSLHKSMAVAIVQCTAIKSGGHHYRWAPTDEICLPKSTYEVSGQVLSLVPMSDPSNPTKVGSWVWDTKYAAFNVLTATGNTQSSLTTHMRHLVVPSTGRLVLPLQVEQQYFSAPGYSPSPTPVNSSSEATDSRTNSESPNENARSSWMFPPTTLSEAQTTLFKRLEEEDGVRTQLQVFADVRDGVFPYSAATTVDTHAGQFFFGR
ncbi:hypothetical protein EUX98_g2906 [Antrodiella citrinella]|uniref:Uncharacterized protein n=1 Tax=Antrodiella citrinella TaxID=2447956 RepID=A0A4S4N642_9APHY|nr:hypothetical protein EUX98_g2906 [Antrodiella citrinella]